MSLVRRLETADFDEAVRILIDAYPGFKVTTAEERQRLRGRLLHVQEVDPAANFYGLVRHDSLQGVMLLLDYTANFLGARLPLAGVGQVAVDLAHKKEHVARDMMLFFLRHYRGRGFPLAALYPFRPDFYRRMGFGYGTKMSQYRVRPQALPPGGDRSLVRPLVLDDWAALHACYQRFSACTHGMIDRTEYEVRRIFERSDNRIVGSLDDAGQVHGYLVFAFETTDNFIVNDLHVRELVHETPAALAGLLAYLHTQADQIRNIIFETQDEDFHHLLRDPRNDSGRIIPSVFHESNTQGVGLMLRALDVAGIWQHLAERDFGGQTLSLRLTVEDSFLPENAGSWLLRFEGGQVRRLDGGPHDVEISMAIEDFSSLLAGSVSFRSLVSYGLATISDAGYVPAVDRIWAVDQKLVCMTHF